MRLGHISIVLVTVIAGLLIHGKHASKLGLYWDDSELWLQPMQWADGNTMRFILSDTFGVLRSERPFAHFLMTIHRAAFAISLSALHWSLVLLLILNAVMLETIASKIVNENWYVFAVGVIFLTYPLAPLHAICPITLLHLWACLLSLLTILFSWYGLRATEMQRFRWFVLAAVTYIATILTHEVFALIPPAFVSLYVLSKNVQNTVDWYHFGRMSLYKPAIWWLSLFVGILGVYGLWRILILPMYGSFGYPNSQIVLNPIMIAKKVLADTKIVFAPWSPVFERISWSPPPIMYVFLSVILFIITWIITVRLLLRSPTSDHTEHGNASKNHGGDYWVQAAMIGIALVIAAVVAIGVSPERVHVNFEANSLSPGPRVNFVATIGIAFALPALLALLVQWCHRYIRLVQCYPHYMRLLGLAVLTSLICVGFIGFPPYGNIFSHKSVVPVLFAHYSLLYGLIVIAYVLGLLLVTGTIALSGIPYVRSTIWPHKVNHIEPVLPKIRAHCLSWAVACIVLLGTLFHFSIKEQFAEEWRRHKAMLEQLHSMAPAIKDDTFVIIVHDEPSRSLGMPYMTHSELSSFLLALYDNWSIMGDTDRHILFYPDGVEARYYERVAMWLPPGVKGPVNLNATMPVPHTPYNRILLFAFDGTTLRMLPEMEVKIEGDERRVVKNNPERILNQTLLRTAIWRHVTQ
jgi:hypothetical protein